MRRRAFIAGLAGSAALPARVQAQQSARLRRIAGLLPFDGNDPQSKARMAALIERLLGLGWIEGQNAEFDIRWAGGDRAQIRNHAQELVARTPDVILTNGSIALGPLQEATQTIPIVFVNVTDPVGGGFVSSLPRPGGNATGFTQFEYGMSGKWLDLLKQVAPSTKRVGILRDASVISGGGQFGAAQSIAGALDVELRPIGLRDVGEIENAVSAFAKEPQGGLVISSGALVSVHRKLIVTLAARHRLPAVYPYKYFVADGGLISYGPDTIDQYRQAATYVDRILRGERPANLPVQSPTKLELVINLKTAKALGLTVPASLIAIADEVIE